TALHRLRGALEHFPVLGLRTNARFLTRLLAHEDVAAGRLDTGLVEAALDDLVTPGPAGPAAGAAAQLAPAPPRTARGRAGGGWVDPFAVPSGWRLGEDAPTVHRFRIDGAEPVAVRVHGRAADAHIAVGDADAAPAHAVLDGGRLHVTHGGITETFRHAQAE